jgi:hypothetical protein
VPEALYAGTLTRVRPCTAAAQTGCIATWATFSESFAGLAQWRAGARGRYAALMQAAGTQAIQCTNPLRWDGGETPAPASLNLGVTMFDLATRQMTSPQAGVVGARCVEGALVVTPEPPAPFDSLALGVGNYHFADVALFHANVARNAAERVAAWRAAP